MKREHGGPAALAIHEAGHLVVAYSQDAVEVDASVWSDRGFTFTKVTSKADWTNPAEKVPTIAAQVAVAVAGGAAELVVARGAGPDELDLADVLAVTGSIDFQLAQEWLALQRHDPSQDAIEAEVLDVFRLVATALAEPVTAQAVKDLGEILRARRMSRDDGVIRVLPDEPEVASLLTSLHLPRSYPLTRTTTANLIAETTR